MAVNNIITVDGSVHLLPGDKLYGKDSNFFVKHKSIDKKTEEIMKEGKVLYQMMIHNVHLYNIHMTTPSKNKYG